SQEEASLSSTSESLPAPMPPTMTTATQNKTTSHLIRRPQTAAASRLPMVLLQSGAVGRGRRPSRLAARAAAYIGQVADPVGPAWLKRPQSRRFGVRFGFRTREPPGVTGCGAEAKPK